MKLIIVAAIALAAPAYAYEHKSPLEGVLGGTIYERVEVRESRVPCQIDARGAIAFSVPCILSAVTGKPREGKGYVAPAIDRDVIHFDPRAAR